MSEHWYFLRISESCVDPNPLMVERQDPDNFTRFQTRERCTLEIAAYVFKTEQNSCQAHYIKRQNQNLEDKHCRFRWGNSLWAAKSGSAESAIVLFSA